MYLARLLMLGSALLMPATGRPQAVDCPTLISAGRKQELADYVRKKFIVPESISIRLKKVEQVRGTCFERLTFETVSKFSTRELTLFLSPDQRFLTDELFDTKLDPIEERHREEEARMAGLGENQRASKGPAGAAVTIVEFSDFECPYCRQLAKIIRQVLPDNTEVRLVFHHMPLQVHAWARTAAEGAACAQLQSAEAFWNMHDGLFRNQDSITTSNVKEKLLSLARASPKLDITICQSCLENEMSLGLVFRDLNLASAYDVNATPTVFINGQRAAPIKDSAQLRQLIAEAEKEASTATKTSHP